MREGEGFKDALGEGSHARGGMEDLLRRRAFAFQVGREFSRQGGKVGRRGAIAKDRTKYRFGIRSEVFRLPPVRRGGVAHDGQDGMAHGVFCVCWQSSGKVKGEGVASGLLSR